jgi:perosamine synthetase
MNTPSEAALAVLRQVAPGPTVLSEPSLTAAEAEAVKKCVVDGWVSSVGPEVDAFEKELASYCGLKRAVVTVNGTAALHLALKVAGVGVGDEVIIPALSFVATANAAAYCGAIPHFVDSDSATLGLSPAALERRLEAVAERRATGVYNKETDARIAACVPMHAFGHPADLDGLMAVADAWGIPVVEDAAESLGSFYKGRHTGGFGLAGVLSFNGNKIITTGGGGAIVTDDLAFADRAKHLSTTARIGGGWVFDHDAVGYNYRMPNLNAALGLAQLSRLPALRERRRRLAARYATLFADVPGVAFATEPEGTESNYWLSTILFDDSAEANAFVEKANAERIGVRPAWRLLCDLPMYADAPRDELTVTRSLAARLVNLPSSVNPDA